MTNTDIAAHTDRHQGAAAAMGAITSLTVEVSESPLAAAFYAAAFGLGDVVRVRASDAPTTGFRGFTLSLVVAQPSTVDSLVSTAMDGGATMLKPVEKNFWGYGGVVQTPDGTIVKVASSAKKDTGPATRHVDGVVLLLGVENVKAARQFYVEQGLPVAGASAASTSSSTRRDRASSWPSTAGGPQPRTPASILPAAGRTGSSSTVPPVRSPTPTGSCGKHRRSDSGHKRLGQIWSDRA